MKIPLWRSILPSLCAVKAAILARQTGIDSQRLLDAVRSPHKWDCLKSVKLDFVALKQYDESTDFTCSECPSDIDLPPATSDSLVAAHSGLYRTFRWWAEMTQAVTKLLLLSAAV